MTGFLDSIRELFGPPANGHQRRPADFWADFTGAGLGYAEAALAREAESVTRAPNGQRNHTLNAAAFSLGQLVAGGALPRERVVTELTAAAKRAGLTRQETEQTIASGLRGGATAPRTVPERPGLILPTSFRDVPQPFPADAGNGVPAGRDAATEDDLVLEYLPRLDWHALWNKEDEEEWIVEPLLPARRLVALYSPPKVGKSLLVLEIAVAVSRGEPVLGVTPDRPRRVLYVDFENDPRGDVRERLDAMGYGPGHLDGLDYLSFPQLAALDDARGGQQLMAAVRVYRSELVVIDTVSRAIKGEENENDTWLNFYRHTGRALKAEGVALIRLDHTGKDETRGQRGGSAKSGDVDAVWRMSKVSETMFRLDCEAHRMPVTEKVLVVHREATPHLRHRVDAEGRYAAWQGKVGAAIELMDQLGLPADVSNARARESLRGAGMKIRNEMLAEALRQRRDPLRSMVDRSPIGGERSLGCHRSPRVGERSGNDGEAA